MYHELVARCHPGHRPLESDEAARWLWTRLASKHPYALATVLMPNHLHLIDWLDDPHSATRALGQILAGFSRKLRSGPLWEPVPRADAIVDRGKLARRIRYVALNPCRARLCRDPLEWLWTTHRDVVGATAEPWVPPERIARALGTPTRRFAKSFHQYVSGDPSVAVAGTPCPAPPPPPSVAREPLDRILHAAAAAHRCSRDDVATARQARNTFIVLARERGWRSTSWLSEVVDVSERQVRRATASNPALSAARLCLADARLREHRWHG